MQLASWRLKVSARGTHSCKTASYLFIAKAASELCLFFYLRFQNKTWLKDFSVCISSFVLITLWAHFNNTAITMIIVKILVTKTTGHTHRFEKRNKEKRETSEMLCGSLNPLFTSVFTTTYYHQHSEPLLARCSRSQCARFAQQCETVGRRVYKTHTRAQRHTRTHAKQTIQESFVEEQIFGSATHLQKNLLFSN